MAVKKSTTKKSSADITAMPMLKTVEQMAMVSGIGENKLRDLMEKRQIEFIQNGNRRLIADDAIWDWYERNKIEAESEVA